MKKIPISVFIRQEIEKAISTLPTLIHGRDGATGASGVAGKDGADGVTTIIKKEVVLDTSLFLTEEDLKKQVKELEKKLGQLEADLRTRVTRGGGGGGYPATFEPRIAALEASTGANEVPVDTLIDQSGTLTYIGKAEPGSATTAGLWQIKRVEDLGGGDTDIRFADGTASFIKIWDNRATFTY